MALGVLLVLQFGRWLMDGSGKKLSKNDTPAQFEALEHL
jgi:hypothetical protein